VRSRTGLGGAQQREESPEAAGEGGGAKGGRACTVDKEGHEPYVDVLAAAKKRQMSRRWRQREGRAGFCGGRAVDKVFILPPLSLVISTFLEKVHTLFLLRFICLSSGCNCRC
jgi:hypothetical protein